MSWLDLATDISEDEIDYVKLFDKWKTENEDYLKRELEIQSVMSTNREDIENRLKDVDINNVKTQTLNIQELFYMRELQRYESSHDEVGIKIISKKLNKIRTKYYKPNYKEKEDEKRTEEENKKNVVDGKFIVPQFNFGDIHKNIIIAGGNVQNNLLLIKKINECNKYDIVYVFGDTRNECDFIPKEYQFHSSQLLDIIKQLFSIQYQKEINSKNMAKIAIILYNAGNYLDSSELHIYFGVGQRYMSFIVMPDISSNPKHLLALEPVIKKFGYCFFGMCYGANIRKVMTNYCHIQFNTLEQLMSTLPSHGYIVADTTHAGFLQYYIL